LIRAQIIGVDDLRWPEVLRRVPHDFYHLPEYAAFSAPRDGGEAAAVWAADEADRVMLLPLVIRPIPGGGQDATSPYGYAGPLSSESGAFRDHALQAAYELLAAEGIVTLFVRLHPLLDADVEELPGTIAYHGPTVVVDLAEDEDVFWRQMRKSHRLQIRRAEAAGIHASIDHDLRHMHEFARLYRATMRRRRAEPYYLFDDAYFEDLATSLGDRLILCVVEQGGRLAAGGLFVETNGIVESHLSADDPALSRGGLKKLVYDHIRRWAAERGDRWLHLGGGVGGASDSLLHFKAGFSPLRRPFRSLRVVTREDDYRLLVASVDPSLDPDDLAGYFPAYRHP
jgi:hypothetical protein